MTDLVTGADGRARCWWCGDDPDYVAYHDDEWGTPLHDERALYELLCLEGFQAGLSWLTILRKRPAFRAAFEGFEPEQVAGYGDGEVGRLLSDAGIVRHRGKITATIDNAPRGARHGRRGHVARPSWRGPTPAAPPGVARPARRDPRPHPRVHRAVPAPSRAGACASWARPPSTRSCSRPGLVDDHLAGCHRAGTGADHRRRTARD